MGPKQVLPKPGQVEKERESVILKKRSSRPFKQTKLQEKEKRKMKEGKKDPIGYVRLFTRDKVTQQPREREREREQKRVL